MKLTDAQREAVRSEAASVAVSAGAGTGKTTVLSARYLHLVLDRKIDLQRILAVTFTEKAAREKRERIRRTLEEHGLLDLAREVDFAPISTIHAFLARVLREYALDADLDPQFTVADEVLSESLLEAAVGRARDALGPEDRRRLATAGPSGPRDGDGVEQSLVDLYLAARSTPHELSALRMVEPDWDALRERLRVFLNRCAGTEGASTKGRTRERIREVLSWRDRLLDLDPEAADAFLELKNNWRGANALHNEAKSLAAELKTLSLRDHARALGEMAVAFLTRLDAAYRELKAELGVVDFSDLERRGYRLLRGPVGERIARDYDHVLVDEYQDTSRIQEAILDCLARHCLRFAVGDAKQSIYRFRYADAAVFQELLHEAERHSLDDSFRCRPELARFTNELFGGLFFGSGVEPQPLRAAATWASKKVPSVEVWAPVAVNLTEGRRAESALVARRLREIVEERRLPRTREGSSGHITYGDCALLLRTTTNLALYERALVQQGVPYVVVKGRGYYAAREVVDLAHLLLLLQDPRDRFRGVAVMTSLLCGATDGDLIHLDPERNRVLPECALEMDRPPGIPAERWQRIRVFSERFRSWRTASGLLDTADLVERIFRDTTFPELMLLEPDGRRRHANLHKALRRARTAGGSPGEYARMLLRFREREQRESEAPIAGESEDAIKVMTVHAAKGLEFPLVAVADLSSPVRGASGPILRPDGVFGLGLRLDGYVEDPPGLEELKEWNKREERNERRRLLYVAMTRAEEHLILSGAEAPRGDFEVLELIARTARPDAVRVERPEEVASFPRRKGKSARIRAALRRGVKLPRGLPRADQDARELLQRVDSIRPRRRDTSPYVVAADDLIQFDRCRRRYRLQNMLGIELEGEVRPTAAGYSAPSGEHPRRLLGTVLHDLVAQHGPLHRPDEEQIRQVLPAATGADLSRIEKWCAWLSELPLLRGIRDCRQERELDFLAELEGVRVRGVIDLYVPDVPLLVDYKTGPEVHSDLYRLQLSLYLRAVEAAGLPAPDRAHLLYTDARQVVEVEPLPLEKLVAEFKRAHKEDGPWTAHPGEGCRFCDFRTACVAQGVPVPEF